MERVGALIQKLQEQHQQNAPAHYLLITAHQLQAALLDLSYAAPTSNPTAVQTVPAHEATNVNSITDNITANNSTPTVEPIINIPAPTPIEKEVNAKVTEPTLNLPIQEKEVTKELNEILATNNTTSLNEQLSTETVALADKLDEAPIADLRKAFSLNEKFLIAQQLFRNDTDMYERSLKTLNNFSNINEATIWMEREFITNLGWNKEDDLVKDFYNKVQRRFSS